MKTVLKFCQVWNQLLKSESGGVGGLGNLNSTERYGSEREEWCIFFCYTLCHNEVGKVHQDEKIWIMILSNQNKPLANPMPEHACSNVSPGHKSSHHWKSSSPASKLTFPWWSRISSVNPLFGVGTTFTHDAFCGFSTCFRPRQEKLSSIHINNNFALIL